MIFISLHWKKMVMDLFKTIFTQKLVNFTNNYKESTSKSEFNVSAKYKDWNGSIPIIF